MGRLTLIIILLVMGLLILYAIMMSHHRENSNEWVTDGQNEFIYRTFCWGLFVCVITFLIPIIVSYF